MIKSLKDKHMNGIPNHKTIFPRLVLVLGKLLSKSEQATVSLS